jgi:translocation and assembly module TamB
MKIFFRITGIILLSTLLLFLGVFLYLQTSGGQTFLTNRVVAYLKNKIDKPFSIKNINYKIPDWIEFNGVYFSDNKGDTLLAGQRLYINIDMLALVQNEVSINELKLENIKVNVKRTLPDTTFNFAYILDAFIPKTDPKIVADTSKGVPLKYNISNLKFKNVTLKYLDDVTGVDAKMRLDNIETSFTDFDPSTSKYHLDKLMLNGGNMSLRLYSAIPAKTITATPSTDTLDLAFKELDMKGFNWEIIEEESGLVNTIKLGKLNAKGDQLYLSDKRVHLKSVNLSNTEANIVFLKKKSTKKSTPINAGRDLASSLNPGKSTTSTNNWKVLVDKIIFVGNTIQYQDLNSPKQKSGLDYSDLKISKLNLNSERFYYSTSQTSGWIYSSSFKDKSGFEIQSLQTDFIYTEKQTLFKKVLLKTPQSILRDELVLNYASLNQLKNDIGKVRLKTTLKNSQLAFKDILFLVPNLAETSLFKGNEKAILSVNGAVSGSVNNLKIAPTSIKGFDQAKLDFQGQITGLPDANNIGLNLDVKELFISKKDFLKITPKDLIPNSIELPEKMAFTGKINGKIANLVLDTKLKSDLGSASFKGKLVNISANKNQQYEGLIAFQDFEMGKFLKQTEQIGRVSLSAKVKGIGIDPKTMSGSVDGTIQQAELKGYDYKNMILQADLANQIVNVKGNIKDPNIRLIIDTKLDISQAYPSVKGTVNIDQLNLQSLGFYADNIGIRGDIEIDMTSTNPNNPSGTILIKQGTFLRDGKPIKFENTSLTANNTPEGKKITINAPFMKANLNGNFNYLQLSYIFISTINKYFVLPDIAYKPVTTPYNLTMDIKVVKHPIIQLFVPSLTRLDTTRLLVSLDSQADTIFRANLLMPFLEYDTIKVKNAELKMVGNATKLTYLGGLDGVVLTSFQVRKTSLIGEVSNNTATFNATFKDSVNKDRHAVAGLLQSVNNQYQIRLKKSGLFLNYTSWQVDTTGYLQYGNAGLLVRNFNIYRGQERLSVNSITDIPNGPINVTTDSLDIQNFVTLFSSDSTLATGKIDGKILLSNYMATPSFTGDIAIKNFRFKKIEIGDINVNAFSETPTKITLKTTINSANNDLSLSGSYYLKTKNSLDLNLNINKLGAETIEAFSLGMLRRAKGILSGKTTIKGSTTSPQLDGDLGFDKVAFDVSQLGSRYLIDQQKLIFNGQTIRVNQFIVSDTLNQPLKLNGTVVLTNIPLVKYDLTVEAKNIMVLNSTRKDNDFFYGKGFVDANLTLHGVSKKAKIEGDIKLRENSKISIIMPSEDDLSNGEGVVEFVNRKNVTKDSIKKDTTITDVFVNTFVSEIALDIVADDKSELTIVVDEINGDNLVVKGNARLNAGINANGQYFVFGTYDLTEGNYGLTYEVLKRQFLIQKGSNIIWTGDPKNADVNITAIYSTSTDPFKLMTNETNSNQDIYRQKMNFDVLLTMSGKLSKPDPSFKIELSKEQNLTVSQEVIKAVKTRLAILNEGSENGDKANIDKQVFALLILNRFFSDKSSDFFSNSGGGVNAEAIARQSVSKLLSNQLDQLASDFIKGVNLDVNLSSSQDYFNGETAKRTDLGLGLSKGFFNDKIEVKVGRNFELENTSKISQNPSEVFDNVTVNYKLSNDGRYLFKVFRKNQFQSVLEGFIVETGVGFTVTMEYGKFKEIFAKKK